MMTMWFTDDTILYHGDCREVLAGRPAGSVDAVVTDPPYGLEFMGKDWDSFSTGDGFRRSRNPADAGRDNVFGRTTCTGPEYSTGAGKTSKPGIGDRETDWPSNQGWNGFRCRTCGHLSHGGSPCRCDNPDFARADNRWNAYQSWCGEWARECFRVLKPGGYLVAFGGTRTYHRLVCGIEDAGFEIRDSVHWIYGSGFPKSLDVSKAIDKAAGAERDVVGPGNRHGSQGFRYGSGATDAENGGGINAGGSPPVTAPATEDAARWDGWGTALKPAHEPIVLARKPLAGTVIRNVLTHGTGALNIDGCRVGTGDDRSSGGLTQQAPGKSVYGERYTSEDRVRPEGGRWPPNLLLSHADGCQETGVRRVRGSRIDKPSVTLPDDRQSYGSGLNGARPARGFGDADGMETVAVWDCVPGCPVAELDRQSGASMSRIGQPRQSAKPGDGYGMTHTGAEYADAGGASRFFPVFRYQAKAPKSERPDAWKPDCSCEDHPPLTWSPESRDCPACGKAWKKVAHPTVKPLALMRWLVRLVTPPGGVVLDLFCGTAPTLQAARLEGFRSIGIDNWDDAIILAHRRLEFGDCRAEPAGRSGPGRADR